MISHPLFGINYFLNRMPKSSSADRFRWGNDLEDVQRRSILSAFLFQWADYAEIDQLFSEFWVCCRLYHLYELLECYADLPFVGTTSPWGAGTLAYLPVAARKLIAALDFQPVIPYEKI